MIALLLLLALTTTDIVVVSLPVKGDATVALMPSGNAELRREGTITTAKIEIQRLPPIAALGSGANTFIAWSVSPEGFFENLGELDEKGQLQATTRFEHLGIMVTAEPHYLVDRPSSMVVFRSGNPEQTRLRRTTVSVEVGAYDYSAIPFPPREAVTAASGVPGVPGVPGVVLQSRASLQVAKSVGADRLAVAELRQAQIAMDTVEEMLKRRAPIEIIWPTANEAIRKSQLAVVASREKAVLAQIEGSKGEATTLRDNNQKLEARVQEITEQLTRQLTEQQEQATERIRKLDADVAAARQEIQRMNQDRDQAAARERDLDAEIAELRQRLNAAQQDLTVRLRSEFIDPVSNQLTADGSDALTRVLNFAAVVAGPIRLEGPASDVLFEAARRFLIDAGIPQERVTTAR